MGVYDFDGGMVLMGYLAGATKTITMLSAVLVLPTRQAVVIAKQAAEIDVLGSRRFRLGVGVGSRPSEHQATGTNFHGRWHNMDNVSVTTPPVQRPIPLWMGGSSDAMLDRVGCFADGWITTDENDTLGWQIAEIREVAQVADRDPAAIGIEGRMPIAGRTPDQWMEDAKRWENLGATHLNIRGVDKPDKQLSDAQQFMKEFNEEFNKQAGERHGQQLRHRSPRRRRNRPRGT